MANKSSAGQFRVVRGPVKGIAISIHTLLIISAAIIVGLTITVNQIENRDFAELNAQPMVTTLSRLLYVAAGLRVITFGIGIKGACSRHTPALVVSYAIFMALIAASSIFAGSCALYTARETTELRNTLNKHMEHYEHLDHIKWADTMDQLQRRLKCCGVEDYKDWQNVTFGRTTLRTPPSCCLPENLLYSNGAKMQPGSDEFDLCGQNVLPEDPDAEKLVYTRGCLDIVSENFREYLNILGVFVLTVGILEVILVLFTIVLIVKKKI